MKTQTMRERIGAVAERRAKMRAVDGHAAGKSGVRDRVVGGLLLERGQRRGDAIQLLPGARGIGMTGRLRHDVRTATRR
jgi:hypothetical protein